MSRMIEGDEGSHVEFRQGFSFVKNLGMTFCVNSSDLLLSLRLNFFDLVSI